MWRRFQRADFRVRLRRAGLTQAEFRALVQRLCGRELSLDHHQPLGAGTAHAAARAIALLVLIERLTLEERALVPGPCV